jgi:hypothetical protein
MHKKGRGRKLAKRAQTRVAPRATLRQSWRRDRGQVYAMAPKKSGRRGGPENPLASTDTGAPLASTGTFLACLCIFEAETRVHRP